MNNKNLSPDEHIKKRQAKRIQTLEAQLAEREEIVMQKVLQKIKGMTLTQLAKEINKLDD